jgi:hypothetical protein
MMSLADMPLHITPMHDICLLKCFVNGVLERREYFLPTLILLCMIERAVS